LSTRSLFSAKNNGKIRVIGFRLVYHSKYTLAIVLIYFFFILSIIAGNDMTTEKIVERIIRHRLEFEQRNLKKEKKEVEAYDAFQKSKVAQKCG
jgi:hypothetical protein